MTDIQHSEQPRQISTAAQWKASAQAASEITVPSGHVCLARNPGMKQFLKVGVVPNSLAALVQEHLDRGEKLGEANAAALQKKVAEDPERIQAMLELIDNVVVAIMVQPVVVPASKKTEILARTDLSDEQKREQLDQLLFVDEVDFEDKLFLFQWSVGGTRDLETFRRETGASLASLQSGTDDGTQPKRAPRPAPTKRTGAPRKR